MIKKKQRRMSFLKLGPAGCYIFVFHIEYPFGSHAHTPIQEEASMKYKRKSPGNRWHNWKSHVWPNDQRCRCWLSSPSLSCHCPSIESSRFSVSKQIIFYSFFWLWIWPFFWKLVGCWWVGFWRGLCRCIVIWFYMRWREGGMFGIYVCQ